MLQTHLRVEWEVISGSVEKSYDGGVHLEWVDIDRDEQDSAAADIDINEDDVGVFCSPDPSKICVNIGLDVYIEMSLDEAVNFTEKKIAVLEKQAAQLSEDATKVKAHIKLVLEVW